MVARYWLRTRENVANMQLCTEMHMKYQELEKAMPNRNFNAGRCRLNHMKRLRRSNATTDSCGPSEELLVSSIGFKTNKSRCCNDPTYLF